MASTAQEALIAELLGDVGKLHDEVKALETRLPAIIEQAENQLAGQVGAITTATRDGLGEIAKQTGAARELVEKYAQLMGKQLTQWSTEEQQKVLETMRTYAGESMALAVNEIKVSMALAANEMKVTAAAVQVERKDARSRVIIAAVIAGLLAGVVGAGAVLWMDRDREEFAEFGKAAMRVLDEKTIQKVVAAQPRK